MYLRRHPYKVRAAPSAWVPIRWTLSCCETSLSLRCHQGDRELLHTIPVARVVRVQIFLKGEVTLEEPIEGLRGRIWKIEREVLPRETLALQPGSC